MSRPASMPVHPPPQPVDSRHHGAVHGARHPVQDRGMKGEQGPDAAGRTTRFSSRWQMPLARQHPRLSRRIPLCPSESHFARRIPPWPSESHVVPANLTSSRRISRCPSESHLVPANPTYSTLSPRIPLHPGESRFVPVNPTLSRRVPVPLTAIAARAPPAGRVRRPKPAWTLPKRGRRNGSAPPAPAERAVICHGRQRCRSPSASGSTRSRSRAPPPSGAGSTSARRAGSIHCGRPTAWFPTNPSSR